MNITSVKVCPSPYMAYRWMNVISIRKNNYSGHGLITYIAYSPHTVSGRDTVLSQG